MERFHIFLVSYDFIFFNIDFNIFNYGFNSKSLIYTFFLYFFRQIEMTEYVEKLFELATTYGHPNLTKFGELVNDEMWWVVTEIVSEQNVGKRIKLMKQFIKVRE